MKIIHRINSKIEDQAASWTSNRDWSLSFGKSSESVSWSDSIFGSWTWSGNIRITKK